MMEFFSFFLLSAVVLYGALRAVTHPNLVVCAFHLAGCLLGVGGLFFIMGSWFLAGVQVIVYAGAVMVLFVMVVMLFDSKKNRGNLLEKGFFLKTTAGLFLTGLMGGFIPLSLHLFKPKALADIPPASTRALARLLFSDYVLLFEMTGVLLLLIAIGVVLVAKSPRQGGEP